LLKCVEVRQVSEKRIPRFKTGQPLHERLNQ
jgi:nucleoid DNA-binding protein